MHPDTESHAHVRQVGQPVREERATGRGPAAPGTLTVRLPFREPLFPDNLFGHLVGTAVPGVEEWRDGAFRCTLRLGDGHAIASLRPMPQHVLCELVLSDVRDLSAAITRCRRLLDLDADPVAVDDTLRADPALRRLVDAAPGRRVPGTTDPEGFAVRAVLGQQVSTAAARTHASRLVVAHGTPIDDPQGGLTHLFPEPASLASLDPDRLALPASRRRAVLRLVEALAAGDVDLGADSDRREARARLAALPGIGPWTVEMIAMRALGDPDAFVPTDLGVRAAARQLALPSTPGALTRRSSPWRPWRAYAVQHLWAVGDHPVNRMPTGTGPRPPQQHR